MSITSNLSLITERSASTKFSEYVSGVDENFQKIDAFAGMIKGAGGTLTLLASNWSSNTYVLTIPDLGDDDAIFIRPSAQSDKLIFEQCGIFIFAESSGHNVTITATTTPVNDISISYFIVRG